jgi:hypothetical protein
MTGEEYWELVKQKKFNKHFAVKNYPFNFPNKIIGAKMTGGVTWSYVEGTGAEDYSGFVSEYTISTATMPELERVTFTPPSIPYDQMTTEDVFYIYHTPSRPWDVNSIDNRNGLNTIPHAIGTGTIKFYSREELEDPWTIDTINLNFTGQLLLIFNGGGNPTSGGRGANADEKRMHVDVRLEVFGEDADFPGFNWYALTFGGEIPTADRPYPWDDPWPNFTDIFTESFNELIADAEYGDTTGSSCDLSFEWLY